MKGTSADGESVFPFTTSSSTEGFLEVLKWLLRTERVRCRFESCRFGEIRNVAQQGEHILDHFKQLLQKKD